MLRYQAPGCSKRFNLGDADMAKKSSRKSATPNLAAPSEPKAGKGTSGEPEVSGAKSGSKKSKPLEMSPIARQALMNARNRSPIDAAGAKKLSKGEVDAIRQLAVALAENELGLGTDEDAVLICNRTTEPSAIPISE